MRDLYSEVTDKVIAAIEAGATGYQMPWVASAAFGRPVNAVTGAAYRGVNILMLGMASGAASYPVNAWASYRQWGGKGAQVRKGERGTMVVYYGQMTREGQPDAAGDATVKRIGFLKCSTVFNVSQVDGFELPAVERPALAERLAAAEAVVTGTGADVRYGFDRAYFNPSRDMVAMPDAESFTGTDTRTATEALYGVLFHELAHWSGAESRLCREFGKRFGDDAYAAEELVAEMASAFLCGQLGISAEPRMDHAKYVASWLKVLKADKRAIFTAAAKASDAAEYIAKGSVPALAIAA